MGRELSRGDRASEIGDGKMQTPEFHTAYQNQSTTSSYVPPGEHPESFKPGDVVLGRAHTRFRRWIISFGQGMRIHGTDRCFIDYTHAALVVDDEGGLIEAVGTGVRTSSLADYASSGEKYRIVDIKASKEDRLQVVEFANWAAEKRLQYNRLATVSIFFTQLTGSKFAFFIDGEFHCSGLVARALERTEALFTKDPVRIMPADLAKYLEAGPADWAPPKRKKLYEEQLRTAQVLGGRTAPSAPALPVSGHQAFGRRLKGGIRPSWWRGIVATLLRRWSLHRPRPGLPEAPAV
jgi:hypothetical protein